MPIPKPHKGEEKQEFISRCIETISDEYDTKQASAICYTQWREKDKKEESGLSNMQHALTNGKWMIKPAAHAYMCKKMESYLANPVKLDAPSNDQYSYEADDQAGDTALIHINGAIAKDIGHEAEILLGMCDINWVDKMLTDLSTDPNIKQIVLCFNSPGGTVTGVEELGRKIVDIDTNVKPIYAFCGNQMDSAAYWLGSQCRKIGMLNSAQIGGIGVYIPVVDSTEKMKKDGVKIIPISSGKYKLLGHEFHKLTEEEIQILTDDVQKQHEMFRNVIKARRPSASSDAMEGLSYSGQDAISHGLADVLVDSLEEYLKIININPTENSIYNTDMKPQLEKTNLTATASTKKLGFFEALKSLMGQYDGAYQGSPDDNKHDNFVETPKSEEKKTEVALPKVEEAKAESAEKDEPEKHDDHEMCSHCQGLGKVKKASETKVEEKAEADSTDAVKKLDEKTGNYDGQYASTAKLDVQAEQDKAVKLALTELFGPKPQLKKSFVSDMYESVVLNKK